MLTLLALGSGGWITYQSFKELLTMVDSLAEPNKKIIALNQLFRRITNLDQELRAKALVNPKLATRTFLQESKILSASLDSLAEVLKNETHQYQLLDSMHTVLLRRNKLFLTYLQARLTFSQNTQTAQKLDSLSTFLIQYRPSTDTSFVSTSKKITTTRLTPVENKEKNLWARLWNKKRKQEKETDQIEEVYEELTTTTDTVAILKETQAIEQIGFIVRGLETDKRLQSGLALQREIDFINENAKLLNQLLNILRDVEQQELVALSNSYSNASIVARKNTRWVAIIFGIFILASIVLISLILLDITRTRFYRQQLLQAKENAENLGALKQEFLANMSHEIRTPLQSIVGFSELAHKKFPASEELVAIRKSSEHLLHIVNEVLDFSRLESGKVKFERAPFRVNELLSETEMTFSLQAQAKNLKFKLVQADLKDVAVLGDAYRLRQILFNLLSNAIKFTNQGHVMLQAEVKDEVYRLTYTFMVTDSGIGMSENEQQRIFEQFEQANTGIQYKHGGSGIGLSIVKTLVEVHGGRISVSSQEGVGSTFTVVMGFDKAEESQQIHKPIPAIETAGPFQGKVLFVDDDLLILRVCAAFFQSAGITYETCQQPELFISQIPDPAITHVFMDIRMPGMNGFELLHLLKAKMKNTTTFIAVTANTLPHQPTELLLAGFDHVLLKPFTENQLLALLKNKPQPTSATSQTGSHVNLNAIHRMTLGDAHATRLVLKDFSEETQRELTQFNQQNLAKNVNALREIIHRWAGRTGQIGATSLSKSLRNLELALENEAPIQALEKDLQSVRHQVEVLVEEARILSSSETY